MSREAARRIGLLAVAVLLFAGLVTVLLVTVVWPTPALAGVPKVIVCEEFGGTG